MWVGRIVMCVIEEIIPFKLPVAMNIEGTIRRVSVNSIITMQRATGFTGSL